MILTSKLARMQFDSPVPDPLFGRPVQEALENLPEGLDGLRTVLWLRQRLPPELARRAAQQVELRQRARSRFPDGRLAYLTPQGLEQATPRAVAEFRAESIRRLAKGASVHDATCGLGSDALALARAGFELSCSDADPFTLACARANLERLGLSATFRVARAGEFEPAARILLLDPDRRPRGLRTNDPERWSPPLSVARELALRHEGAVLKLPPAHEPDGDLCDAQPMIHRWISLRGQLAEVSLWTGILAGGAGDGSPRREAIALDGRGGAARLSGEPRSVEPLAARDAGRIRFLAEPDPAVIRAGLLGWLAAEVGLRPVAEAIAYLGGDQPVDSPFLKSFRVLGSSTADRRQIQALLRRHDIGRVTVKKRGHPDPSAVLERRWRGRGSRRGLLAVTRLAKGHLVYLLEPLASPPSYPPSPGS